MNIRELRRMYKITIDEASESCGVPLRTFIRYEKDEKYGNELKRKAIIECIKEKYEVTEEKGIISIDEIKKQCEQIFKEYGDRVIFCYLFGSYAKGYATDASDIDLLVSTNLTGFEFIGLIEKLRERLNKKIDLLRMSDQSNNIELLSEIMKDGIKIYG